jgi:DNA-binding NarL/FixJ family response regulator
VTRTIKLLVAEDHALMRDGLRLVLGDADGIQIVGEARDGTEVLPLVASMQPDVVLLDLRMPGMDGLTCLDQIRERYPTVKVVVFSALDSNEQIEAALRRGADGYVVKTINPVDLASAVRQAVEGSVFHPFALGNGSSGESAAREAGLSEKEVGVLRELAHGRSNKEIARALFVSEQTVKFHLRNIYRKLGIATRTEALRFAYQNNLVEAPL